MHRTWGPKPGHHVTRWIMIDPTFSNVKSDIHTKYSVSRMADVRGRPKKWRADAVVVDHSQDEETASYFLA